MNSTKEKIFLLLIGIVAVAIVVALAIGVSLVRSSIQQPSEEVVDQEAEVVSETEVDEELSIHAQAKAMHEDGHAEPSEETLEIMQQMNDEVIEYTPEEEAAIRAKMEEMSEASGV